METRLIKTHGCVALTGTAINHMAGHKSAEAEHDKQYHVTLFTKEELRGLDDDCARLLRPSTDVESPVELGLGKIRDEKFRVLYWPQGNSFRKQYGLSQKQFHITIDGNDDHDIDKGVRSIIKFTELSQCQIEDIVQQCISSCKNHETRSSALEIVRFLVSKHANVMKDRAFDGLWRILSKFGHADEAYEFAFSYVSIHPDSIASQLRCADSRYASKEAKKAMFHYAQAIHLALQTSSCPSNILPLCVKGVVKCSQHTEFGSIFRGDETGIWEANTLFFNTYREAFSHDAVRKLIQDEFSNSVSILDVESSLPQLSSVDSDMAVNALIDNKLVKLPRFFRWLLPFRLAVMSQPKTREHIQILATCGITLIVTLTDERSLPSEWFEGTPCRNLYIPVRDHKAPSNQQVDTFVKAMDVLPSGEAALIHCAGGKGRAGTFAACYLMARGFRGFAIESAEPPYMFPNDSIRLLRHIRPRSVETVEQENFIKQYANNLAGAERKSYQNTTIQEAHRPLNMVGELPQLPSLIVCCGIPGSGKSTFSSLLTTHLNYTIISQDELGTRQVCLSAMANALQQGKRILIDRCNPYPEDRSEWLAHAFYPSDALCVWFDIDRELCIQRADSRINHPTIAQGRARKVIFSFSKTFVAPSLKEKFCCVARVPSSSASQELLLKFGISEHHIDEVLASKSITKTTTTVTTSPKFTKVEDSQTKPFIHKFPRTRHLFNLGSATRDDLLLSDADAVSFLTTSPTTTITLEEKVDGANMGITASFDSPSGFLVQNRSHYITSASHAQFKKLDKWIMDHTQDLTNILRGDQGRSEQGRWILYGEWLYAKHSIHYTSLPSLFLAFDLYDTIEGYFLSREELGKRLQSTNVHHVRSVPAPETLDQNSLVKIVKEERSRYCEGVIEGLYVRREEGGKTVDRAKIVREDFIAGNEHWSRGIVTPNLVEF